MTKLVNPPSYEEFKKWVKKQGIKTSDEFKKFYRTKLPPNYPKDPQAFFTARGTWKGWGDIIGKEPYRLQNTPSYEEFKKWVQKQGIKNQKEFAEFDRKKFPLGYTKGPTRFYKNKGWAGWNDLCGTEQHFLKDVPSYAEFKKWIQKHGITSKNEFAKFDRKKFPSGYPKNPDRIYKKQRTWKGWGDLFGIGNVSTKDRHNQCRSFKKARKFVHSLKLKSREEWMEYCKSGKLPKDIPFQPIDVYKNRGYTTMGDWLGTGYIANRDRKYLPPIEAKIEARKIAKKLGIKTQKDWSDAYKAGKIPNTLPSGLWSTYGPKGRMK